jgi:hypothetical protein
MRRTKNFCQLLAEVLIRTAHLDLQVFNCNHNAMPVLILANVHMTVDLIDLFIPITTTSTFIIHSVRLGFCQACYMLRDLSAGIWEPIPGRSKDYITMPKPSGYQSLHLTVKVEPPRIGAEAESASPVNKDAVEEATTAGPSVELQFRTQREHPPLMTSSVLHPSLQ